MEGVVFSYDSRAKTVLLEDFEVYEMLRTKDRICPQPMGTLVTNSNQNELQGPPFALNLN